MSTPLSLFDVRYSQLTQCLPEVYTVDDRKIIVLQVWLLGKSQGQNIFSNCMACKVNISYMVHILHTDCLRCADGDHGFVLLI